MMIYILHKYLILIIFLSFSFSLKFNTSKRLESKYNTLKQDYDGLQNRHELQYVVQRQQDDIKEQINDITLSLLKYNEVIDAANLVSNVHYQPNIMIQKWRRYYDNNVSKIPMMQYINKWIDRYIYKEKTNLKTEIERNIHKRSAQRLKSQDLFDDQLACIIVAKQSNCNEICGLVEVWPKPYGDGDKSGIGYLCNLSVSETSRSKGIGEKLQSAAHDICLNRFRLSKVYLHVKRNNKIARNFYQKIGYRDKYSTNEMMSRFLHIMQGENDIVLFKDLE